jgi:hypothetical protein
LENCGLTLLGNNESIVCSHGALIDPNLVIYW